MAACLERSCILRTMRFRWRGRAGVAGIHHPGPRMRLLCGVGAGPAFVATVGFERTARAPPLAVIGLALSRLDAAVFFAANLASLRDLAGPEIYGFLSAVQRMTINLGTVIDASGMGALLAHGSPVEHVASWTGIPRSWVSGAMTRFLAIGGLQWSFASPKRRGHVS